MKPRWCAYCGHKAGGSYAAPVHLAWWGWRVLRLPSHDVTTVLTGRWWRRWARRMECSAYRVRQWVNAL